MKRSTAKKSVVTRFIKKFGLFAVPLLIAFGLLLLWVMKPLILSSYLTSCLGVRVMVESIRIGPSQTHITDFKIKNPLRYKNRNAFKADSTEIDYQFSHLLGNPSEIDQITITDIFLSIEFDSPLDLKNNWTQILERLPKPAHREKQLIIHKLLLDNLKIEIRGLGISGTQLKEVAHIELDEINSLQGFPTAELVKQIFGGAGLQDYLQDLINPTNTLQKLFNPSLFGTEGEEISNQGRRSR